MSTTFLDELEARGLDPEVFRILDRVLRERANVNLDDLDARQRALFLALVARGIVERAAREKAVGGSIEVQGGN